MRTAGRVLFSAVLVAGAVLGVGQAGPASAQTAPSWCPTTPASGSPLPATRVTATLVTGGHHFLEGPVWDAGSQTLLVSDLSNATGSQGVQPSAILRVTPSGTVTTFQASSGSNGMALSTDGSTVLAATHDPRGITAFPLPSGTPRTLVETYQGAHFNSPNDLTVRSDGTIFFSDPSFQRGNRADEMGGKTGVFRLVGSTVQLLDNTLRQPNGVALSPDESTLYVGENTTGAVYRYPLNADGSVGTRTKFATVSGADGVSVDCAGNVYWASYNDGKVHVLSPDGVELGTISAGTNTTNVAFGGSDRRTLYLTSGVNGNFGLYAVQVGIPGSPY